MRSTSTNLRKSTTVIKRYSLYTPKEQTISLANLINIYIWDKQQQKKDPFIQIIFSSVNQDYSFKLTRHPSGRAEYLLMQDNDFEEPVMPPTESFRFYTLDQPHLTENFNLLTKTGKLILITVDKHNENQSCMIKGQQVLAKNILQMLAEHKSTIFTLESGENIASIDNLHKLLLLLKQAKQNELKENPALKELSLGEMTEKPDKEKCTIS